jgi:hypothetical protein
VVELTMSVYDGRNITARVDVMDECKHGLALQTPLKTDTNQPKPDTYQLAWDDFQEISRGGWKADPSASFPKFPIPKPNDEAPPRPPRYVQLNIERGAGLLRRVHWESHQDMKDRLVFRYQAAESLPRPASLPRPQHFVLAMSLPHAAAPFPKTIETDQGLLVCDFAELDKHLPSSYREAVVLLALRVAVIEQELVVDQATPNGIEQIALAPRLAALRDQSGQYPQLLVLMLMTKKSTAPDHRGLFGGRPFALAHDLVAAGMPMVAICHDVADNILAPPVEPSIVSHLQTEVSTMGDVRNTAITARQLNDLFSNKAFFPHKPVIVTRFRSGHIWADSAPTDADLASNFRRSGLRTVVVGPQLIPEYSASSQEPHGSILQPWLRAPIDILHQLVRVPMYPEDLRNGYQLGSYIQSVLKDRKKIEALYFLSWIRLLYFNISHALKTSSDRNINQYITTLPISQELSKITSIDASIRASIRLLIDGDTPDPQTVDAINKLLLSTLVVTVKTPIPTIVAHLKEQSERLLKEMLDVYCPFAPKSPVEPSRDGLRQQAAEMLLKSTPWWRLAQLKADLYITVDPMPFLEYALALQQDQESPVRYFDVQYTVFPWYLQTDAFFPSRARSPTRGALRRVLYLCGSIVDPPILLLSEEEVVERLLNGRLSWPYLLSEIGDCLGQTAVTLFLGFSPDDALFRQILRTLFLDRQSSPGPRLIVAPRPDGAFYSYPQQGAQFLVGQLEHNIPEQQRRATAATSMAATQTAGTAAPAPDDQPGGIQLAWGDPHTFLGTLLDTKP